MVKTLLLLALACSAPALARAQVLGFQHIVIVYQENRSPDNLFQGLCGPNRHLCPSPYNLQNFGTDNKGAIVNPSANDKSCT
jgi:phospholipase C